MSHQAAEPLAGQDQAIATPNGATAEHEVGYCKPPRETQFKKGHSGNPRGVRKPMSTAETAAAVLRRCVTIAENGKRRRTTVQEVILISQANRAAKGDHKSAKMLFELNEKAPPPREEDTAEDMEADFKEAITGLTLEQLEIIADYMRNLAAAQNRRRSQKPK